MVIVGVFSHVFSFKSFTIHHIQILFRRQVPISVNSVYSSRELAQQVKHKEVVTRVILTGRPWKQVRHTPPY